jgi:hypothetical protein
MSTKQKIRIRLKAFDYKLIDQSALEIVETAKRTGWSRVKAKDFFEYIWELAPWMRTTPERTPVEVMEVFGGYVIRTEQGTLRSETICSFASRCRMGRLGVKLVKLMAGRTASAPCEIIAAKARAREMIQ